MIDSLRKKFFACFVIVAIAVLCSQSLSAYCAETNFEEKSISFIENIAGLDLTIYQTELTHYSAEHPKADGDLFREEVRYVLKSGENTLKVGFQFINNTLVRYFLSSVDNMQYAPIYIESAASGDALEVTKGFLERYLTFSNSPTIQQAKDSLNLITEIKTQNLTVGDVKMQITVTEDNSTFLTWIRTINGLDFATGLSIRVRNGILDLFDDKSSFFKIGTANVDITRNEAIAIAWEQAKTITNLNISLGDSYEIVPFSLISEPKLTELQIQSRSGDAFTMYPLWHIEFRAEKIQYGINGAEVGVWADTGEIAYVNKVGYQGIISNPETASTSTGTTEKPSPSSQPTNTETSLNNASLTLNAVAVGLVASITTIAVIATIFLKRKKE